MNSFKCPECGLVNFATATECKRCHVKILQPEPADETPSHLSEAPEETAKAEPRVSAPPLPDYFHAEAQPLTEWCFLFATNLGLAIVIFGIQLVVEYQFTDNYIYEIASDPNRGPFHLPSLAPLLHLDLIFKGLELLAAIVLLLMLAGRWWLFLRFVRVYLLAGIIYQAIEVAAFLYFRSALIKLEVKLGASGYISSLSSQWTGTQLRLALIFAGVSIILRVFWLGYFNTSTQVRTIFIN